MLTHHAHTQTFNAWLERKLGTRSWVVAPRLTDRMRANGYTLAVTQKRFAELRQQFTDEAP